MLKFINDNGDFVLANAQRYQGTYFPLVNESGIISSVTPMLGGDCKTDQNTYLLPPASAETLHESRATYTIFKDTKLNPHYINVA